MSEEKSLTMEIAKKLVANPESFDISPFEKWDKDVICFILESTLEGPGGYDVDPKYHNSFKSAACNLTKGVLTAEVAEWPGPFWSEEGSGKYIFNNYTSIEDKAAEFLATKIDQSGYDLEIHLHLNELTSLSETAAKYLSQIRLSGWLELNGLTEVNEEVASHLSSTTAFLSLAGVQTLSDEAARNLSQRRGIGLTLGLTSISDQAAEHLSNVVGSLDLDSLSTLSDEAAESLSRMDGEMPPFDPLGQPMGEMKKARLSLKGLEQLSDASANSLSKFRGLINFKDPKEWAASLRDNNAD